MQLLNSPRNYDAILQNGRAARMQLLKMPRNYDAACNSPRNGRAIDGAAKRL
jgi:hypothetical protein